MPPDCLSSKLNAKQTSQQVEPQCVKGCNWVSDAYVVYILPGLTTFARPLFLFKYFKTTEPSIP